MANPFLSVLGGNNPMAMLAQLKSDPMSVLRKAGYNVPPNLNDPNAIIQHLMDSGQISQQQMNTAQQMAHTWGLR